MNALLKRLLALTICLSLILALPLEPTAHDSPVDHVDRAIRIYVENGKLYVRYQVQLSERSATMQLGQIDTNGDGSVADAERAAFFTQQQKALCPQLSVSLNEKALALKPEGSVELLPQFRQVFTFSAEIEVKSGKASGEFVDRYSRTYPGAYRWDEPKRPKAGAPKVIVSEAPKVHRTDGHPSQLQIKFEVLLP
jgi:hypothetical protein